MSGMPAFDGSGGLPFAAYAVPIYGGITSIGNGGIEGRFKLLDTKTLVIQIRLGVGSTTSLTASQMILGFPTGLAARISGPGGGTQSLPCRYYTSGSSQFLGFASTSSGYGADRMGLVQPGGAALTGTTLTSGSNLDINGILELA